MRTLYVFRQDEDGRYKPVEIGYAQTQPQQSAGPYIIDDSMGETWHPANDQYYDSKSAFRRVTKEHGFIEKGNDKIPPKYDDRTPQLMDSINRAFYEHGLD